MLASRVSQCSARPFAQRGARVVPRGLALGAEANNGVEVPDGSRIKVSKPLRITHLQKYPKGVELEGLEGVMVKNVANFKGKVLSASHPFQVKFSDAKLDDGTPVAVTAHLVGMRCCGSFPLICVPAPAWPSMHHHYRNDCACSSSPAQAADEFVVL